MQKFNLNSPTEYIDRLPERLGLGLVYNLDVDTPTRPADITSSWHRSKSNLCLVRKALQIPTWHFTKMASPIVANIRILMALPIQQITMRVMFHLDLRNSSTRGGQQGLIERMIPDMRRMSEKSRESPLLGAQSIERVAMLVCSTRSCSWEDQVRP